MLARPRPHPDHEQPRPDDGPGFVDVRCPRTLKLLFRYNPITHQVAIKRRPGEQEQVIDLVLYEGAVTPGRS